VVGVREPVADRGEDEGHGPGLVLADAPGEAEPERDREERARHVGEHHVLHDPLGLDHVLGHVEGERGDEAPADECGEIDEQQDNEASVPERDP
jgi:hypothetical protein